MTGLLPQQWLAPTLFGELLIGSRDWVPVAAVAFVVITLLTVWSYRKLPLSPGAKVLAIALKIVGVMLLAVCLIEPLFSGVRPRPGANLFVVLTDNSQSMTVQSGSEVRGEGLQGLLRELSPWRTRLQQDFDVRDYIFDNQLKHIETPEEVALDGSGSALHTALDTIKNRFRQRPVAGVLLMTDGNATDLSENSEFPFPIYPVVDEDSAQIQDVRIRQMTVAQTNFEAAPITVAAQIASQGYDGRELMARIVAEDGKVIQEQTLTAKDAADQELRFRFRPLESGLSFARMEVFARDDQQAFEASEPASELTLANNQRWMTVDRGGGPFRILYVSGRPNWEFKFLRRALDEDDEINLTGLIRIAKEQPKFTFQDRSGLGDRNQLFEGFDGKDDEDAETYDQTVFIRIGVEDPTELADGFPRDGLELFKYHAVILDDIEAKFFTADQMLLLRRFVNQRGGGLIMLGGQESFVEGRYDKTPVGETLPVYLGKSAARDYDGEPFAWTLTREGWLRDWTRLRATEQAERKRLSEIPGLKVVNVTSGLKPGASLLAAMESPSGKTVPALVTQRFGRGRSAAILSGDLWRWRMHQRDPAEQDLQQLWRQIIRWMVADVPKRVRIKVERPRGISEASRLTVTVLDDDFQPHDNAEVIVKVTTPEGEEIELSAEASTEQAGDYVVDYWPRKEGPYRATAYVTTADGEELDAKQAGWTSQPAADEFRDLKTNRELLGQLASDSGGEVVEVDQLHDFVSGLPSRKVPVTEKWVYPIWHQWWVLTLAFLCLCGEWGIRRWRGLP